MEPAGQASHASSLVSALKKPAAHCAHVMPPNPHLHHSEVTRATSNVASFAPQAQQPWASAQPLPAVEALATASLKVPSGHAAQTSLDSRKPALQRQELAAESVAGMELAGHGVHAVEPVAAEYNCAGQLVQVLASVASLVLLFPESSARRPGEKIESSQKPLCQWGLVYPAPDGRDGRAV